MKNSFRPYQFALTAVVIASSLGHQAKAQTNPDKIIPETGASYSAAPQKNTHEIARPFINTTRIGPPTRQQFIDFSKRVTELHFDALPKQRNRFEIPKFMAVNSDDAIKAKVEQIGKRFGIPLSFVERGARFHGWNISVKPGGGDTSGPQQGPRKPLFANPPVNSPR